MIKIFYAGDSTVQTNNIHTYPQTGIGQVLHLYLKPGIEVKNHARNGRSTKSFIDESRLVPIYDQISKGDYLFIQFGHNDEKIEDDTRYTDPFGEFKVNLGKFINVARNKGATPVLITPLARRCFDESGVLGPSAHKDYVEAAKQVANEQDVAIIDLTTKSREALIKMGAEESTRLYMHLAKDEYPSCPEVKVDNTHLKYDGAVFYAGLIAEGLKELGGQYEALLAQPEDIENLT